MNHNKNSFPGKLLPDQTSSLLKKCLYGLLLTLAFSCAKGRKDGQPETFSPLQNSASSNKSETAPNTKPNGASNSTTPAKKPVWSARFDASLKTHEALSLASFQEGKWNGTYEQSRCQGNTQDGAIFKTIIEGAVVKRSYRLFVEPSCKQPVKEVESVFAVVQAEGEKIQIKHNAEWVTLFSEKETEKANLEPLCAAGWPAPGERRDVSKLGVCGLEPDLFSLLLILKKETGVELYWGSESLQSDFGDMDGSAEDKRHMIVDGKPYLKIGLP